MLILRTKTDDGITTFVFENESDATKAAQYVMKTTAAGFVAKVNSPEDTKGEILQKWDHKHHLYGNKYERSLSYYIRHGRYRDTEWAVIGTKKECDEMAEKTNKNATCWADTTCCVQHLIGPVWQCVHTSPYLD